MAMSGAVCMTCFNSTNDATMPVCSRADCPNKPQRFFHALRSPDACDHDFQGWRDHKNEQGQIIGGEQVCAKCGMGAMDYTLRSGG